MDFEPDCQFQFRRKHQYQRNYNYTTTFAAYNKVEFDYYLLSNGGSIAVSIMQEDWSKYYGYYSFNKTGPASSYDGVDSETLQDGYIHITMTLPELNLTNHQSGRTNAPTTVGRFYIRGDWSSAYGLIDNITFSIDDSIGIDETPTLQNNLEMVEMDAGMTTATTTTITHTDVYGNNSTSARKFTFEETDLANVSPSWGRPRITFSPEHSGLSNIDLCNTTMSIDIKLSSEFFDNDNPERYTFVLIMYATWNQTNINVYNFLPGGAAVTPEKTDNGWIHVEQDMNISIYAGFHSLIRMEFQFFGLNDTTKATAWAVIDNITFTPNT